MRTMMTSGVLLFVALLACKSQSGSQATANSGQPANATPGTVAASSSNPPDPADKLEKSAVCTLYGKKSGSEQCDDCIDDAELDGACERTESAFQRCVGDPEAIGKACAGECVNQCVRGHQACCECTADCVAKRKPTCAGKFLATEKCKIEKCKSRCGA